MRGIETCWAIGLSNSCLTVFGEGMEGLEACRWEVKLVVDSCDEEASPAIRSLDQIWSHDER